VGGALIDLGEPCPGFSLRFVVRIGAVATPPTYVATRLVLPREAGGSVSAWIVPLDATDVSAFETEWMPELRAMEQHDVGWDWRGELNRSANVPEFELYALVAELRLLATFSWASILFGRRAVPRS
jgi:hypothetical protein